MGFLPASTFSFFSFAAAICVRHGSALVESLGELVDGRRDLQALVQNLALALQAHVRRPLDVAAEVASRLDGATDAKVLGGLLEQRVGGPRRLLRRGLRGTRHDE